MITEELKNNINSVRADARRRKLKKVTVEHLVLILLTQNVSVRHFLALSHVDIQGLKRNLSDYLGARVPVNTNNCILEPEPSASFQRVLERAITKNNRQIRSMIKVDGIHVLSAVFAEPDSYAAYCMQKCGLERLTISSYLARQHNQNQEGKPPPQPSENHPDLVDKATRGDLEKPFGREQEVDNLIRILSRKYKNNPLLIGEPGVGKTAMVSALAHKIASDNVPSIIKNARLLQVNLADMIAGTKYRGDFEQRLRQFIDKCHAHGNTILFIDEIHTIVGTGAVAGGNLDAANILKPLLNEEKIRYIGATTFNEYRHIFEKDNALSRRFQKIEIREPDDTALRLILRGVINHLHQHHTIEYDKDALSASIDLSRRYLPNRFFPDKAIDLLDDAGAACRLSKHPQKVDRKILSETALKMAGLPIISEQEKTDNLITLKQKLQSKVLDQPTAADCLSRSVLKHQLGFYEDETKTVGAFLFCGPTGVGKTEMAKQLAINLGLSLLRYDMSEYMERHSISRLIGAPPGYVGFEQSGKLVEDVFRQPASVVLFDEIDKAHPDVVNILLQILDYGTLTDNNGQVIRFTNTIIILTSNIGSQAMERGLVGFSRDDQQTLGQEAMNRFFSSEFRNRLNAIVWFQPLSPDTIAQIVDKRLTTIIEHLKIKKGIRLSVSKKLRTFLKKNGFSETMGARPLERLLQEYIFEPLALAQANNHLLFGMHYHLDINGGHVALQPSHSKPLVDVVP